MSYNPIHSLNAFSGSLLPYVGHFRHPAAIDALLPHSFDMVLGGMIPRNELDFGSIVAAHFGLVLCSPGFWNRVEGGVSYGHCRFYSN